MLKPSIAWVTKAIAVGFGACIALSVHSALSPKFALRFPKAPTSIPVEVVSSDRATAAIKAPKGLLASSVSLISSPKPVEADLIQSGKKPKDSSKYAADGIVRSAAMTETELNSITQGQKVEKTAPSRRFIEEPGGLVLVLGLLVNSNNLVLDARILVPSSNPLTDNAILDGAIGQRWDQPLSPPLNRGESRWIEFRVSFVEQDALGNLIP